MAHYKRVLANGKLGAETPLVFGRENVTLTDSGVTITTEAGEIGLTLFDLNVLSLLVTGRIVK